MNKKESLKRKFGKNNEYSTTQINRQFKIKISGTYNGSKYHNLVGVTGLFKIVGKKNFNSMIERAFRLDQDYKCDCKLRSGLKVTFYYQ